MGTAPGEWYCQATERLQVDFNESTLHAAQRKQKWLQSRSYEVKHGEPRGFISDHLFLIAWGSAGGLPPECGAN